MSSELMPTYLLHIMCFETVILWVIENDTDATREQEEKEIAAEEARRSSVLTGGTKARGAVVNMLSLFRSG
jgi:hypothetical protein